MQCPFCGIELHEDELFCADCTQSLGLATTTAVVDRPAVPEPVQVPTAPPRRKSRPLGIVLIVLCALSLITLALLVGAYYDTLDPLQLQEALWPDGGYDRPPAPDEPLRLEELASDLEPLVTPVSRGAPLGDGDRADGGLLLRAAVSLDAGLSAETPPTGETLTGFLWQALRAAQPLGRFDPTPDGYFVPPDDLYDLCRETLGFVPVDKPPETSGFAARDDGYEWREQLTDDHWRIDIYDWELQLDGSVRARFNVLYAGMLYDSFERQGEAVLFPNDAPVYFRYRLDSLTWREPGRFKPSRITASASLRGQDGVSYMPDKLIDGDPATAWIAGDGGDGAWLELAFDDQREVTGLTVVNGFCKDLTSMRQYSRVKRFRLECGDFSEEFELEDVPDYHTGGDWQSFTFGRAVPAGKLTLTILSRYDGGVSDHTCVSEIELF